MVQCYYWSSLLKLSCATVIQPKWDFERNGEAYIDHFRDVYKSNHKCLSWLFSRDTLIIPLVSAVNKLNNWYGFIIALSGCYLDIWVTYRWPGSHNLYKLLYEVNQPTFIEVLKCTYNQTDDESFNLWDTSNVPLFKF